MHWLILNAFVVVCFFFLINLFEKKNFHDTTRVSNSSLQIRPDDLSGLIWSQAVCNGYQTDVASRQRMKAKFALMVVQVTPYQIQMLISRLSVFNEIHVRCRLSMFSWRYACARLVSFVTL